MSTEESEGKNCRSPVSLVKRRSKARRKLATMNDERSAQAAEYYKELQRFVELCADLTATGKPYLTVLLCHELYRFLYPAEPYLGFTHEDPVPFLLGHIRRLVEFGAAACDAVRGYPNPIRANALPPIDSQVAVEKQTSDLYSELWLGYDARVLTEESRQLLTRRIPERVIDEEIVGRSVLDLGCGSGRYAVALAGLVQGQSRQSTFKPNPSNGPTSTAKSTPYRCDS